MALEEESKSARVIRKCSSVLNRFLRGIEGLQRDGSEFTYLVEMLQQIKQTRIMNSCFLSIIIRPFQMSPPIGNESNYWKC